jgi:hypothetical protein
MQRQAPLYGHYVAACSSLSPALQGWAAHQGRGREAPDFGAGQVSVGQTTGCGPHHGPDLRWRGECPWPCAIQFTPRARYVHLRALRAQPALVALSQ